MFKQIKKGGEKIKMKKIKDLLVALAALFFGLSVVLISARRASQAQVLGQADMQAEEKATESGENKEKPLVAETIENKEVDYYLPYPGILPDHPFYWLKMVRDRISLLLTNEPMAKFEKLLLYADKRLGAAKFLTEGGKKELGVATVTKGEKYLEKAIDQFKKLKQQGKTTPELTERLRKATLKHEEVIQKLLEKAPDQVRTALETALEKAKSNTMAVMQLMESKQEGETEEKQEEVKEEETSLNKEMDKAEKEMKALEEIEE